MLTIADIQDYTLADLRDMELTIGDLISKSPDDILEIAKTKLAKFKEIPVSDNFVFAPSINMTINNIYQTNKEYIPQVTEPKDGLWSKSLSEKLFDALLKVFISGLVAEFAPRLLAVIHAIIEATLRC